MTKFNVQILGCGSALPTTMHMPSSQLVDVNGKLFMIDCGEGTQLQMRKFGARMSKLHSIFISHMHGDHVFGLPGLISSFNLLGRTAELTIYAHQELEDFINPVLNMFCKHISYNVRLVLLKRKGHHLIYENKSIQIFSFPLKHRIASTGFLFKEKEKMRHMKREMEQISQRLKAKLYPMNGLQHHPAHLVRMLTVRIRRMMSQLFRTLKALMYCITKPLLWNRK